MIVSTPEASGTMRPFSNATVLSPCSCLPSNMVAFWIAILACWFVMFVMVVGQTRVCRSASRLTRITQDVVAHLRRYHFSTRITDLLVKIFRRCDRQNGWQALCDRVNKEPNCGHGMPSRRDTRLVSAYPVGENVRCFKLLTRNATCKWPLLPATR
ncbi:hypothetical protein GE09DRAFT_639224 [Coniochaeta sp. 2T2.1]|nr:hypothetical protein GE09DRAFT_639224 [Coniochaeta sp. 2T2.1]